MRKTLLILLLLVALGIFGLGLYPYIKRPADAPITEQKVVWKKQLEVDAKKMQVNTGIDVTGKLVRIEYTGGTWSNGGKEPIFSDANGYPQSWPGVIVPNAPLRALVGKTDAGAFLMRIKS